MVDNYSHNNLSEHGDNYGLYASDTREQANVRRQTNNTDGAPQPYPPRFLQESSGRNKYVISYCKADKEKKYRKRGYFTYSHNREFMVVCNGIPMPVSNAMKIYTNVISCLIREFYAIRYIS